MVILKSQLVIRKLNVIKGALYKGIVNIDSVVFRSNGKLEIKSKVILKEHTFLETINKINFKNSTLTITNSGEIEITNDYSHKILWKSKFSDFK